VDGKATFSGSRHSKTYSIRWKSQREGMDIGQYSGEAIRKIKIDPVAKKRRYRRGFRLNRTKNCSERKRVPRPRSRHVGVRGGGSKGNETATKLNDIVSWTAKQRGLRQVLHLGDHKRPPAIEENDEAVAGTPTAEG